MTFSHRDGALCAGGSKTTRGTTANGDRRGGGLCFAQLFGMQEPRPLVRRRRLDLVTRTVNGEIVILDHPGGFVHRLNASASRIWTYCDGSTSAREIAERFASDVAQPPENVIADVLGTISEFERLGLLAPHGTDACASAPGLRSIPPPHQRSAD